MKPPRCVLVIVLAVLATSSAFIHVTPWDKEVIYNWQALVEAGTFLPQPHASLFSLKGKIHLQPNSNFTFVKITDLTYQLYNGVIDHLHEKQTHEVPIPHEVESLTHVFKIIYDNNGLALGIVTEEDEKEFSRNIKKAIGTVLQMDETILKKHDHHPYGFVTKEPSIYGEHDVDYNVIPHEDWIEVHKYHDMKHNTHMYQHFFSNYEKTVCDSHFENPIMHLSMKNYKIIKEGNHYMVKHIETTGAMVYYPHQAKSDHQFTMVNQTFHLMETNPVKQPFHMESGHFEDHLTYHAVEEMEDGSIPDETNGRHMVNYEKMMPNLKHMLQDIHQYLQEDHINTEEPNSKRGQLINRVHRLMKFLSMEKLQELRHSLTGVTLDIFHKMLPLIGTKASTMMVKQLVVSKEVTDDVAVSMLHNLPEHVVEPTVEIIAELEPLMHLPDSTSWNVKKTAILSFASLIHRSHAHESKIKQMKMKHHGDHETTDKTEMEKPYEKYVVEYVTKFKTSSEYKVQMVYGFGLYNMKLYSVKKHVLPMATGEWTHDYHLRLISLMASTPSVLADHNTDSVIETYWPILTNRKELTELRVLAYYYIMQSRPTHSRLMNLNAFMMTETNEELHHFHYTYVQSMMHSHDPCQSEFHVKLGQIFTFIPPPSHGLSYAQLHDYKDVTFGFSGSLENYFINTNHSRLFGIVMRAQDANVVHEEYLVYVKVHGVEEKNFVPANIFGELFSKKFSKMGKTKDIHIEVVIAKQDNIINTFYFDEHNLHELNYLLEFFTQDGQPVKKNMLDISYHVRQKMLLPNDIGFPMIWEKLVPEVYQHNLEITKEVTNKIANVHVDMKLVNWAHYRHGLSFYNPIVDVWQGINRYHSFDVSFPMNFDITFNMQQQILQLSMKKHQNPQMNIAGFKTHVKQMVFIKDDNNKNVLVQSSPQSKDFVVVGFGKQFRNDYTIVDKEDLTTGHKYMVKFFDSSRHISNGTVSHQDHLIMSPQMKHFDSPWSYLWVTISHYYHFIATLPKPGTYGYMFKMEPSTKHAVSNIDLSLRLNTDTVDDSFFYSPARKWSARLTYAVKNHEQSLRTWDVNAIVDLNPGHTVNNLKMHLTRIVPGKQDYKICVDGVKKWTQKGVTGHLNVAMSETPDGKCVKDDTVVDITMTGQFSDEQVSGHHKYGACQYVIPYSKAHYHTMQCLVAHTTLRHYIYNVKTVNVPTEFKKMFTEWWDSFKANYMPYYNYETEHNEEIGEHTFKVDMKYPMQQDEVDIQIMTSQHLFELTAVPTDFWEWFGVSPDSLSYSKWFEYMHQIDSVDHCVVYPTHHMFDGHDYSVMVPNDWTMYVGDAAENPQKAVYVKDVEDKIAVKVLDGDHVMEIIPRGETHQITLDGKVMTGDEYHHEPWVYYHIFTQDVHHPVAVMFPKSGVHIEYDGDHMVIVVPKVNHQLYGSCYTHH